MEFWIFIWTATLVLGIAAFVVLAITVSIGGYHDARELLRKLETRISSKDEDRSDGN